MYKLDTADKTSKLNLNRYFFLFLLQATLPFRPYFFVAARSNCEREVASYLTKKFVGKIASVETVKKEDLELVTYIVLLSMKFVFFGKFLYLILVYSFIRRLLDD